jgi:hypothetical protein
MPNEGRILSLPELNPLHGDEDNYRITPLQVRIKPTYELLEERKFLYIDDPLWDKVEIGSRPGDDLIVELYNHPLVQRLTDVEQLTLPLRYSTMPGTTNFTRWEHAWGSLILARKLIDRAEVDGSKFTDRQKIIFQLRTFLSDMGHTAFSHLGDWLLQGFGGNEDQHDQTLLNLLEIGGIGDLLSQSGIELKEVVGGEHNDWLETPSPDLCVDRVDYGLREISRWIDPYPYSYLTHPLDYFRIHGNRLVMKDKRSAKFFGVGFGLLATEHWSHPIHRLQLHLFGSLVKGAIVENGSPVLDRYDIKHPADMLYTTDSDLHWALRMVGELNNDLHSVMLDLARNQRRVYAWGREDEIQDFVSENAEKAYQRHKIYPTDFLHPLESRTWKGKYSGVKPPNVELIPVIRSTDVFDFNHNPSTLDVYMPSLKARSIDPFFITASGRLSRLSRADRHYAKLLEQHKATQAQAYVARVHLSPDFVRELKDKINKVDKEWESRFHRRRVSPETLKRAIGDIAWHASLGRRHG